MSLEVATREKYPEARVLCSAVAESIVLVNVLADPRHHASEQSDVRKLWDCLSQESVRFLKKVAALPFQGIEFLEILLDCQAFNGIEEFVKAVREYDNIRFIRVMTGDKLTDDQIAQLMQDRKALPQRLRDLPWVYRGETAVYENFLFETSDFKESLIALLQEVFTAYSARMEPGLRQQYQNAAELLHTELAESAADDVAAKIMNRRIEQDPSVCVMLFLPSYYVNPHYIMAYNRCSRLFLYDMRTEGKEKGRANQKLTDTLKILSDSTRLEILRLLILQPTYGKILADRLRLTTATISHHLDILSSAGFIHESRDGNTKYFSADEEEIQRLFTEINDYLYNK